MALDAAYRLAIPAAGLTDIRVTRVRGVERVHAPFRVEVTGQVVGSDGLPAQLEKDALVGERAEIALESPAGARTLFGVIDAVGETARGHTFVVVPRLAALAAVVDYRVWLDKNPVEIVTELLGEHGVDVESRVVRTPEARPQCVQAFESGLEFAARILAEEGVLLHVDCSSDADVVVLSDASSAYVPMVGGDALAFAADAGLGAEEHISSARFARALVHDKVSLRDFDFEHPRLDQTVEAEEGVGSLERYEHRGGYVDPAQGAVMAGIRLEEVRGRETVLRGRSTCTRLAPGHTFTLSGAPRDDMNGSWLVIELAYEGAEHGAAQAGAHRFEAELVAVPADRVYRPARPRARHEGFPQRGGRTGHDGAPALRGSPLARLAPRATEPSLSARLAGPVAPPPPAVRRGVETATVTGPSGEEIHTEEFGRVKVLHRWDRRRPADDTSSAWLRPVQPPTSGGIFLPRVGWEVLLGFSGTSADLPFELGRLDNAIAPPAEGLPGHKVRGAFGSSTSPGGGSSHGLTADDTAGNEHLTLRVSRDLNDVTRNDRSIRITLNDTLEVGVDRSHVVGVVHEELVDGAASYTVSSSREMHVTGPIGIEAGDEVVAVGGLRYLRVGGNYQTQVDGFMTRIVAGLKMETAIEAQNRHVNGAQLVAVGGSWKEVGLASARNVGGLSVLNVTGPMNVTCKSFGLKASALTETYDSLSFDAGGERGEEYGAAGLFDVGGNLEVHGSVVVFLGEDLIKVKVGGVTFEIEPGQIKIDGPFDSKVATIIKGDEKNS